MREYKCPACSKIIAEDDLKTEEIVGYEEFWGFNNRVVEVTCYCPFCGEEIDDNDEYYEDDDKEYDDE